MYVLRGTEERETREISLADFATIFCPRAADIETLAKADIFAQIIPNPQHILPFFNRLIEIKIHQHCLEAADSWFLVIVRKNADFPLKTEVALLKMLQQDFGINFDSAADLARWDPWIRKAINSVIMLQKAEFVELPHCHITRCVGQGDNRKVRETFLNRRESTRNIIIWFEHRLSRGHKRVASRRHSLAKHAVDITAVELIYGLKLLRQKRVLNTAVLRKNIPRLRRQQLSGRSNGGRDCIKQRIKGCDVIIDPVKHGIVDIGDNKFVGGFIFTSSGHEPTNTDQGKCALFVPLLYCTEQPGSKYRRHYHLMSKIEPRAANGPHAARSPSAHSIQRRPAQGILSR